jgi:hypothetical protein
MLAPPGPDIRVVSHGANIEPGDLRGPDRIDACFWRSLSAIRSNSPSPLTSGKASLKLLVELFAVDLSERRCRRRSQDSSP